jgi:hypothetical protein
MVALPTQKVMTCPAAGCPEVVPVTRIGLG